MKSKKSADRWERLESFRTRAKEAEAKAAETDDPQVRIVWTQIAQSWRLLADHLARQLNLYE